MSEEEKVKVDPFKSPDCQLAEHAYRSFNLYIKEAPDEVSDLENPDYWVHIAPKMRTGDEVRVVSEDMSFYTRLLCTYAHGTAAVMKVVESTAVEGLTAPEEEDSKYKAELRGPKGWCVINSETGEVVKEKLPNQATAVKEAADYEKILSR